MSNINLNSAERDIEFKPVLAREMLYYSILPDCKISFPYTC